MVRLVPGAAQARFLPGEVVGEIDNEEILAQRSGHYKAEMLIKRNVGQCAGHDFHSMRPGRPGRGQRSTMVR